MPPQNPNENPVQPTPAPAPVQPTPAPVTPTPVQQMPAAQPVVPMTPPVQPVQTIPMATVAPKSGSNWGAIIGILIIVILLAAGGAYFFYLQQQTPAQAPVDNSQAATQSTTSDVSIQNDLNTTGNADASADVENLNNSL